MPQENPEKIERSEQDKKFEGDVWELESKISEVSEAGKRIEDRLASLGWDDKEVFNFGLAINEAIANAVIHGNLEVKREEGESKDAYEERTREAEQKEENKSKKVIVEMNLTGDEAEVTVRDEGHGFEPEKIPDPTADEKILETTGRGIFFMKQFCDGVEFSPGKAVLRKKKTRPIESGRG